MRDDADKILSIALVAEWYDLVESFALANHAEIGAGTFLGRFQTLFEVHDLGVERVITIAQLLIQVALIGDCRAQFHGLAVTAVGKPQLRLQQHSGGAENDEQPAQI